MNPCEDQERAVKSLSSRVELIHGPPGTGKSTTIFHVLSARMPAGATKRWNHGNDMNDLPMTPGLPLNSRLLVTIPFNQCICCCLKSKFQVEVEIEIHSFAC